MIRILLKIHYRINTGSIIILSQLSFTDSNQLISHIIFSEGEQKKVKQFKYCF